MIFAPNPTGAVTVANAVVFWANVRAAVENDYILLVRIDDQWAWYDYPGMAQSDMVPYTMHFFLNSFQEMRGYLESNEYTSRLRCNLPMIFRSHRYQVYWHMLDLALARGLVKRVADGCYRLKEDDTQRDGAAMPDHAPPTMVMQNYAFSCGFMASCDIHEYNVPLIIRGENLRFLESYERIMLDALGPILGGRVQPEYRYTPSFYMFPYPFHSSLPIPDGRNDFLVGGNASMRKSVRLPMMTFHEWARRFKDKKEVRAALEEIEKMGDTVIYHEDGSIEPWEAPK